MNDDFQWRDGERLVFRAERARNAAARLLRERGMGEFELLSTERALADAPQDLLDAAVAVHPVGPGGVPEVSAAIVDEVGAGAVVAFGGGRVIDSAKAIGAVRGLAVAAIPTTLSGAEMTTIHRLPEGRDAKAGMVRPRLVIADPELMTGAPEAELRASAMNALAHGAEALYTPFANPVASLAAVRGARALASALGKDASEWDGDDRGELALGSLLCAYALDSAGLALHHVICQTLVRVFGTPHAETNAAVLPQVLIAMRTRAPEQISELSRALGSSPELIGDRVEQLAGGRRALGEIGADRDVLDEALDAIEARPDLRVMTPDPPGRDELRELILAAW
jgi:alcohol dehydrogenase class IV